MRNLRRDWWVCSWSQGQPFGPRRRDCKATSFANQWPACLSRRVRRMRGDTARCLRGPFAILRGARFFISDRTIYREGAAQTRAHVSHSGPVSSGRTSASTRGVTRLVRSRFLRRESAKNHKISTDCCDRASECSHERDTLYGVVSPNSQRNGRVGRSNCDEETKNRKRAGEPNCALFRPIEMTPGIKNERHNYNAGDEE